ncbi:MAG TPA: TolC family protein [Acidobacteriaceae bacterium]|nr:TolC family protein [Acidobacteriaceae bacterium]
MKSILLSAACALLFGAMVCGQSAAQGFGQPAHASGGTGSTILLATPYASSTAISNAYSGSVTTVRATAETIPLSLDDAIRRGLEHNLALVLAQQNQRIASGTELQGLNYLLPNISAQAARNRNDINLVALGFRPGLLAQFPPGIIPPGTTLGPVVTVNEVSAQANLQQSLFDLSAIEEYRAEKEKQTVAYYQMESTRGFVILDVATSYLQALADAANVANARGLLDADAVLQQQTKDADTAGTATHLDLLRAQVQYQQQEQVLIADQNALDKAKIALNRQIGLPAEQPIQLTDQTPYADLAQTTIEQARRIAYANRQDYQGMQAQLRAADRQRSAARYERLPSLSFQGNYGVTGTVGGIYHGTFLAEGNLSVPLFREASLRGDRDVAEASKNNALSQLADLHTKIEAQLRDSLLDIAASKQLVEVARSNVDLAHTSLSDATDRFKNGVDDNLPVVQAQATLASAQAQLVNSLYQFNQSKLGLARNLGIIEQQYHAYLGNGK